MNLNEASRDLTTFQNCFAYFHWWQLSFRMNSLAEILQKMLEQFQDMKGVIIIADDLVMFGRRQDEHDRHFQALLERSCQLVMMLNPEKLEMGLDAITFMGHNIREDIGFDTEKVHAIRDLVFPETVGALRRLLGMTIYVGKFIPNLITIIKLLQDLTKNDFPGIWLESQQAVFDTVKTMITNLPDLASCDPRLPSKNCYLRMMLASIAWE